MGKGDVIIVLCTCPDQVSTERISQHLLERHLAACVNTISGVRSWYRWQTKVEIDKEELLLIKTTHTAYPALQSAILEIHPYDLPEIIAVPVDVGYQAYLDWVISNTAGQL